MRWVWLIVGAALVVVGAVWVLQGLDVLKGSFMTGRAFWAWMGAVAVLAGIPVLMRGLRPAGPGSMAGMPQRTPAPKPNRPRDPDAPPKPGRPRDELGRPLPRTARNLLEMEDYDSLSVEENHRLGIEHLNAGRYFPAHEAWETAWKQVKGTAEEEFFKGLSQLGAGYVHWLRGNPHGAHTLLRRGAGRIQRFEDGHRGVGTTRLAAFAFAQAQAVEEAEGEGRPSPELEPPRIEPAGP